MLAQAVKRLYPEAKLAIGPSIENGFYYDFECEPFSREDLDKLEAEMKKIIKEGRKAGAFYLPREEAIAFMKERNEPYKVELIEDLSRGCGDFLLSPGRRFYGSVRRPSSDVR